MNSVEFQPIESIKISEPRIEYLKKKLENLLRMVKPGSSGKFIDIDGFYLKDLRHWTVPSYKNTLSIVEPMGRMCNLDCKFCYLKGNPPDLAIAKYQNYVTDDEMETRLRYYKPAKGTELFRTVFGVKEVLCHPKVFTYLSRIRRRTKEPFFIVTNGTMLNEKNVGKLDKLRPVFIVTSLNSRNISLRSALMKDNFARVAIKAPKLLKKHKIPFGISITPWLRLNEEDLERTIRYADDNFASFVRVILPGYTRFVSKERIFDTHELWQRIVGVVKRTRCQLQTPVFCVPSIYEADHLNGKKNEAVIVGCIRNSPASSCGISAGDIIVKINRWRILNRYEAKILLCAIKDDGPCRISVKRGENTLDFTVNVQKSDYPYYKQANSFYEFPFGIVLPMGFDPNILKEVGSLIKKHQAKKVAILASTLVAPIFRSEMEKSGFKKEISKKYKSEVDVVTVRNHYLGGNMMIGDMLVADDFVRTIKMIKNKYKRRHDLFVLPSSPFEMLSTWKMDISGRSMLSIERETGETVEFISSTMIGF